MLSGLCCDDNSPVTDEWVIPEDSSVDMSSLSVSGGEVPPLIQVISESSYSAHYPVSIRRSFGTTRASSAARSDEDIYLLLLCNTYMQPNLFLFHIVYPDVLATHQIWAHTSRRGSGYTLTTA